MARLIVLVEGQTEEDFVNEILLPHLIEVGFHSVTARLLGNARPRSRRGGIRGWPTMLRDIVGYLKEDPRSFVTMMVDYYGLPQGSDDDKAWPGRRDASTLPFQEKAKKVEREVMSSVSQVMGHAWNPRQFVPFVVMHEFESLLFSDCEKFAIGLCKPELKSQFQEIRDSFASPEEINDSPTTGPSKRVLKIIPEYEKPLYGNRAAVEIGLSTIRRQCLHFGDWLGRIELIPIDK